MENQKSKIVENGWKEVTKEEQHLMDLQKIVDTLKEIPEYVSYVKKRNLYLIDIKLQPIDVLLRAGVFR